MKAGHIAAAMCLTLVTGCGLQAVVTAPTPTSTDTAIVPVPSGNGIGGAAHVYLVTSKRISVVTTD